MNGHGERAVLQCVAHYVCLVLVHICVPDVHEVRVVPHDGAHVRVDGYIVYTVHPADEEWIQWHDVVRHQKRKEKYRRHRRISDSYAQQVMIDAVEAQRRSRAIDQVIVPITHRFGFKDNTLTHAITLLNRISRSTPALDLAAVGCLMIAAKMQEVMHPLISDLAMVTGFAVEDLREAEIAVMESLDFNMCAETAWDHVNSELLVSNERLQKHTEFFVSLVYCRNEMLCYDALTVALACIYHTANALGASPDPPTGTVLECAAHVDAIARSMGFTFAGQA